MSITNRLSINLTPIRLHSVSSVRIPHSVNDFKSFLPSVRIRPLKSYSASNVILHGLSNFNVLRNNACISFSPIRSSILRKYSNSFKRPRMYPNVSKCNVKRCNCCNHLCTKSTITSSVNGINLPLLHLSIILN